MLPFGKEGSVKESRLTISPAAMSLFSLDSCGLTVAKADDIHLAILFSLGFVVSFYSWLNNLLNDCPTNRVVF